MVLRLKEIRTLIFFIRHVILIIFTRPAEKLGEFFYYNAFFIIKNNKDRALGIYWVVITSFFNHFFGVGFCYSMVILNNRDICVEKSNIDVREY